MTCLKKDQIGNQGLSRVIGNYERPVYKEVRLKFNESLCSSFTPRHRDRSALHNVLVKRSSDNVFLHRDLDSGSSLQRDVMRSLECRSKSRERVPKPWFHRPHQ